MIGFTYNTDFTILNEEKYRSWISEGIDLSGYDLGEIQYFFYNDDDLHKINQEHLQHDTYTDIISFDYSVGNLIAGDICISVDRVKENAEIYATEFEDEMARVMCHGILHFFGYKDKTEKQKNIIREQEDLFVKMLKNK